MMRGLAAVLAAFVIGLPLVTVPSWPTLVAVVPAAVALTLGILVPSLPVLATGILVSLTAYTVALCSSSPPTNDSARSLSA